MSTFSDYTGWDRHQFYHQLLPPGKIKVTLTEGATACCDSASFAAGLGHCVQPKRRRSEHGVVGRLVIMRRGDSALNKAFVREPESTAACCPRCGSQGERVGAEVLSYYLTDDQRRILAEPANFCPAPQCAVAYFDDFEQFVPATALSRPAYPKDPTAPICACFGLTHHDIEQDVDEGVVTRTRAAVEKAQSPGARCARMAANGRPCVTYVQKYYMECLGRQGGNR